MRLAAAVSQAAPGIFCTIVVMLAAGAQRIQKVIFAPERS
jgi:hypothetical protein